MECIDCSKYKPMKGRRICSRCKNRRYEVKHPITVAYHRLKGHAKARGKHFSISLEYFTKFCTEVQYIAKRGKTSTSIHIDRIEEHLGYIEGNIQPLQNADNVRKYKRWKQLDINGKSEFEIIMVKPQEQDEDCPF